ncbi:AraC family transcriptional regulator [Wukongibacter baidiensis]|uniref:AraC family transcriptional regulator n=1 Tax=Wukongibacter baidiensis TaxID=1723361 RepID=UPI003D7F30FA
MDYYSRIQNAVDYVEENLTSKVTLEEVSSKAYFSMYHFHRIFNAMVGSSIKDYIRMRRLTEAAYELISTEKRIIDIAIEYQFESQESFTRAFKKMYGITPGKYRKNKNHLILMQKKRLTVIRLNHLKGGITLKPKIVEKSEFKIIGMKYYGSNKNNEIPELWSEFIKRINEIKNRVELKTTLGVCEYVPNMIDDSEFSYIACVMADSLDEVPDDMVGQVVAKNKYAVFTHRGATEKLGDTYEYIHGTWLPKSGYELAPAHDFELYDERFNPSSEESEMDIYIPIK